MVNKKQSMGSTTVTGTGTNGKSKKVIIINNTGHGTMVNINSQVYKNNLARRAAVFTGKSMKAKNESTGDRRQQLVNTYLSFAYEMGPGLKRKIFRKYILLIMYSIDNIAGSSTNFGRYSKLYDDAESLTGTVDIEKQDISAKIIIEILSNAFRIESSTSKNLISLLNF